MSDSESYWKRLQIRKLKREEILSVLRRMFPDRTLREPRIDPDSMESAFAIEGLNTLRVTLTALNDTGAGYFADLLKHNRVKERLRKREQVLIQDGLR